MRAYIVYICNWLLLYTVLFFKIKALNTKLEKSTKKEIAKRLKWGQ